MEYPVDEAIFEKCHINSDMLKAMLYVTEFRKAICNTTEKINYSWSARTFLDIANRHSAGEIEIPQREQRPLHRVAKYFRKQGWDNGR